MHNYWELFIEFFRNDFKLRYKKSYLGVLWAIIKPLINFFILFNVWAIFGMTRDYAATLLAGIVMYHVFSDSFNYGMKALLNKAHIILKIYFPREIVIYAASAVALINFFFNFWVILAMLKFEHIAITPKLIGSILITVLIAFLFGMALAIWVSVYYVKFRDLQHVLDLVLYMWFWLTPVMYPMSRLEGNILYSVVQYNPLTPLVQFLKQGIAEKPLQWSLLTYPLTLSVVLLILGAWHFKSAIKRIAEYY